MPCQDRFPVLLRERHLRLLATASVARLSGAKPRNKPRDAGLRKRLPAIHLQAGTPRMVDHWAPMVTTCWSAKEPRPMAALRLLPPLTRSRPWRPALPPTVSTCCCAVLLRPSAAFRLCPPKTCDWAPRPAAWPPMVVTDWSARLLRPTARLALPPPKTWLCARRPNAAPPTVVVSCSAVLLRPSAAFRLCPPKVALRAPGPARPPMVVEAWPAKLFRPTAAFTLPPPRVMLTPPVSRPWARTGLLNEAAPASNARAAGRMILRMAWVLLSRLTPGLAVPVVGFDSHNLPTRHTRACEPHHMR